MYNVYVYIFNGRAVLLSGRVGLPAITVFIRPVIITILLFLLYTRGRYEIGATVASQRRYIPIIYLSTPQRVAIVAPL